MLNLIGFIVACAILVAIAQEEPPKDEPMEFTSLGDEFKRRGWLDE